AYIGALIIAEGLILAQVGLGALLWLLGLAPSRWVHILYGFTLVLALPAAHLYGRGRAVTYGLVALFAFGLTIRGITTA
ncbi:MAG: hypothetical protein HYX89_05110, partial [Chloroflexi bacterium]|nr:hypothetical protein [Chloroflexota bacterium]